MVDGGASIRILNLPLFPILADHFLKCSKFTPNNIDRKILTVANKVEFPHLFNLFLTLHTSIHGCTCTLVVPVANINYNILGTPFFKTYVKLSKLTTCLSQLLYLMNFLLILFLVPPIRKRATHISFTFIQMKLLKTLF